MTSFATSLAESYQRDKWGLPEALREIIANALDGQARGLNHGTGKAEINYDPSTQELSVSNERTEVGLDALLMGTSESRGREDTIGTFGEGLPMALLTFTRENYVVRIESGWHSWVPYFDTVPRMPGTRVLHIKTRKLKQHRPNFTVRISGIRQDEYDALKSRFLSMESEIPWREGAYFLPYDSSRPESMRRCVLTHPEMIGKIFVKGVFICFERDLAFGYNLDLSTNRDRGLVDRWDLSYAIADLLSELLDSSGVDVDALSQLLFVTAATKANSIEARLESRLHYCSKFITHVHQAFVEKYGSDAYPASSSDQVQSLEHVGLKGIIVPPLLYVVLTKVIGRPEDVISKKVADEREILGMDDLSAEEADVLRRVTNIILEVTPEHLRHSLAVQACRFHEESDLEGLYQQDELRRNIYISRRALSDFGHSLSIGVHEVAHCWGADGRREHHSAQENIWKMIANMFFSNLTETK